VETINGEASFTFTAPGTYTFYAYNEASDGRVSSIISAQADASYEDIPLPTPEIINAPAFGDQIQIQVRADTDRLMAGAEVRYTRGEFNDDLTSLPAITEAEWKTSPQMNVAATVPRSGGEPMIFHALFPVSGSFRVFLRLLSNVGTRSPIAEVGVFRFELQATSTQNFNSFPSWAGSFENMIVWPHTENRRVIADPRLRDTITYEEWNGYKRVPDEESAEPDATKLVNAWPFGDNTGYNQQTYIAPNLGADPPIFPGSTAYRTRVFEMGEESATREITVTARTDSPEGIVAPEDFDIIFRHSAFAELASPSELFVVNGTPLLVHARTCQAIVHLRTSRSQALVSLTVGWRDIL